MIVSKPDGKVYAACRKHLGIALDFVGGGSVANIRVMDVKGVRDLDGRSKYTCHCTKRAVFYLYEVEERPSEPAVPYGDAGWRAAHPGPFTTEPEAERRRVELARILFGAPVSEDEDPIVFLNRAYHEGRLTKAGWSRLSELVAARDKAAEVTPCPVELNGVHKLACVGCGVKGGDW